MRQQEENFNEKSPRSFQASLLATLGIAFVIMLVALDQTVVGTALPTIVAELGDFSLYTWVATAYLLASVVTVPIFGRLGDLFGRKYFIIASIIIFTGASALCGIAVNMMTLVIARACQGIGGGMLIGTAFSALADLFPDMRERLRWQVIISSAFGLASVIGPPLGGLLTQYYGWRSTFYVNLPIGLISLILVWYFFPSSHYSKLRQKFQLDWLGALLLILTLSSLQLGVELFPKQGLSIVVISLIMGSALVCWLLWKWEKQCKEPILPPAIFQDKNLRLLFILSALSGISLYAMVFFLPLLFQGGLGLSPKAAGWLITPLVFCITLGSILNSRIITRINNANKMLSIGFLLLALTSFSMVTINHAIPHYLLTLIMVVAGIGLGLILPNLTIFSQQVSKIEDVGISSALLQSARMVGGMVGMAFVGTIVNHFYIAQMQDQFEKSGQKQWVSFFNDPQILVDQKDQINLLKKTGPAFEGLIHIARDALISSIHNGLILSGLIALLAFWLIRGLKPISFKKINIK